MMDDDEFLGLLFSLCNMQNGEQDAGKTIESYSSSNPMQFIYQAIKILLRDDVDEAIQRAAIVLSNKTITPSANVSFSMISSTYLSEEFVDMRPEIRDGVIRGVLFEDQTIRETSALMLSFIVKIEKLEWPEVFELLPAIASNYSYSSIGRSGSFLAFENIINNSNVPDSILQGPSQVILDIITGYINPEGDVDVELFCQAASTFCTILKNVSIEFNEEILAAKMDIVNNAFNVDNERTICKSIEMLYSLFQKGYPMISDYISPIYDRVNNCMQLKNDAIIITGIDFFSNVFNFEGDIKAKIDKYVNPKVPSLIGFSNAIGAVIVECLISLQTTIDESESDSFTADYTHTHIEESISNIFQIAGVEALEYVNEYFNANSSSNDFKILYSALSALCGMTAQSYAYCNSQIGSVVYEYLAILLSYISSESSLIVAKTFEIIRNCIKNFGCWIGESEPLEAIIGVIRASLEGPKEIASLGCEIISVIISYPCVIKEANPLNVIGEVLHDIIYALEQRDDLQNTMELSKAKYKLIDKIPNELIPIYLDEYNAAKEVIHQLAEYSGELKDEYQYQESLVFIAALSAKAFDPLLEDSEGLLQSCTYILEKFPNMYAQVLVAINGIVCYLKSKANPFAENIVPFVIHAFSTLNEEVITSNVLLIQGLFSSCPDIMKESAEEIFGLTIEALENQNYYLNTRASLIRTIGTIVQITTEENYLECISGEQITHAGQAIFNEIMIFYSGDAKSENCDAQNAFRYAFYSLSQILIRMRCMELDHTGMPEAMIALLQEYIRNKELYESSFIQATKFIIEISNTFERREFKPAVRISNLMLSYAKGLRNGKHLLEMAEYTNKYIKNK